MDYENIKTKGDKRANVKEKLSKKQVKHWYWNVWRKITELHFSWSLSKSMQKMVNDSMWLTKKELKEIKIQKKKMWK